MAYRERRFNIAMSRQEIGFLEELARREGLSKSATIRRLVCLEYTRYLRQIATGKGIESGEVQTEIENETEKG